MTSPAGRLDSFRFQKLMQGIPIDVPIARVIVQARVGGGGVGGQLVVEVVERDGRVGIQNAPESLSVQFVIGPHKHAVMEAMAAPEEENVGAGTALDYLRGALRDRAGEVVPEVFRRYPAGLVVYDSTGPEVLPKTKTVPGSIRGPLGKRGCRQEEYAKITRQNP